MINVLISFLGLQILFIILRGTKFGRLIYLLGKVAKQVLILNYNILKFILKQTKDINKKLKDKIYNRQNKKKEVKHKKVVNGENIIDFKNYKKQRREK